MESTTINNGINAIKEVRKLFSELRGNLSREETKNQKKTSQNTSCLQCFKGKRAKRKFNNRQKNMLKNDERYLKNIRKHLKNLKKHFFNMVQIIYLMNPQPQIMILMSLEMLESFLMTVEVIFYVKKQRELEKNSIKKKLLIIL